LASNLCATSFEPASVMESGFYYAAGSILNRNGNCHLHNHSDPTQL